MESKTIMTQNDFNNEMIDMSQSFGLDIDNFSLGIDSMYESIGSPIPNKPEIYKCPWDNQGDIILFV
jgi:hypothetical protein